MNVPLRQRGVGKGRGNRNLLQEEKLVLGFLRTESSLMVERPNSPLRVSMN
jgi:hypothetical protein